MTATKVFISYSWSTPDHENWVLRLATELRESGVDAQLDKWDLKEGHEATAFMEKMVQDTEITKVLIVSDRIYCDKSNERRGGAGTEAQIISREIYEKQDQNKFVALVVENDANGKALVPVYYSSRIFIDFTNERKYADSFEQLIRWIENKPIHKKPEIGLLPGYIREPEKAIDLATSAVKRRALDAVVLSKPNALAAVKEYFQSFLRELNRFRFSPDFDPLSDEVQSNFEAFISYRDESLELVIAICNHSDDPRYGDIFHGFFEGLLGYFHPPEGFGGYNDFTFDNYKFFSHELFLYFSTMFIKEGRFDYFNAIVEKQYYLNRRAANGQDPMRSFTEFRQYLRLLKYRNDKIPGTKWISPQATLLKSRVVGSGVEFEDIMQSDFILFLREGLFQADEYSNWWPETLIYLGYGHRAFEVFERSRSAKYFEKIRPLLGGATKDQLGTLFGRYEADQRLLPRFDGSIVSPTNLTGYAKLCTLP